jgi:hypothetical protein
MPSTPKSLSSPLSSLSSPIPPQSISRLIRTEPEWTDLNVSAAELRVTSSVATGQCFNWRPVNFVSVSNVKLEKDSLSSTSSSSSSTSGNLDNDLIWVGVLGNNVIALKETPTTTLFSCLNKIEMGENIRTTGTGAHKKVKGEFIDEASSSFNKMGQRDSMEKIADDLRDYFQLNTALAPLYQEWAQADERLNVSL